MKRTQDNLNHKHVTFSLYKMYLQVCSLASSSVVMINKYIKAGTFYYIQDHTMFNLGTGGRCEVSNDINDGMHITLRHVH